MCELLLARYSHSIKGLVNYKTHKSHTIITLQAVRIIVSIAKLLLARYLASKPKIAIVMAWTRTILYSVLSSYLWHPSNANYVWPNEEIDELERILFEQESIFGSSPASLASIVSDCSGFGAGSPGGGRNFGAEWLRTAYHDMSTADVNAGTGGLDASIIFETDRPENPGKGFSETFLSFKGVHTTRSSMSDLFAMAAVIAVGSCSNGKVIVPFKGGRVDAAGPGPSGVPQPQEDLASHTANFARQGFDVSEMISLVACGHSIGGVHGVDFPEIVPNPPDTGVSISSFKPVKRQSIRLI